MWTIIPQTQKTKDGDFTVDVCVVKFRPSSEKEKDNGAGDSVPMRPTLRLLFKHDKGDRTFKITAQFRKPKVKPIFNATLSDGTNNVVDMVEDVPGQWYFNLHEPARVTAVETRSKRSSVVMERSDKVRVEKKSSGSVTLETFFTRILPERVKDDAFVDLVATKFDEVIVGGKVKKAA